MKRSVIVFLCVCAFLCQATPQKTIFQLKGFIAPKYETADRLSYVSSEVKKGGVFSSAIAKVDFNTFNPYLFLGWPAEGSERLYATLMFQPLDDVTNLYAYGAESYEQGPGFVRFKLRDGITFEDGSPITAEDVAYGFQLLKQKGKKDLQVLFNPISVDVVSENEVVFKAPSLTKKQLFYLALLPLLKKVDEKELCALKKPLASGAYRVESFKKNHHVSYQRVPNWWGETLWMHKNRHNFDHVKFFYIPNEEISFQAFKKKAYLVRRELNSQWWHNRYGFSEKKKDLKRFSIHTNNQQKVGGVFFNTKNSLLKMPETRRILRSLFDFKTLNQSCYFNAFQYKPTFFWDLFWINYRKTHQGKIQELIQKSGASRQVDFGGNTEELASVDGAKKALEKQGWVLKGGALTHEKTGKKATLLIVALIPYYKNVLQGWVQKLRFLGIDARIKMTTPGEYFKRLQTHAYDVLAVHGLSFFDLAEGVDSLWQDARTGQGYALSQVTEDNVLGSLIHKMKSAQTEESETLTMEAVDTWTYDQAYFMPMWVRPSLYMASWGKYVVPESPQGQADYDNWSVGA